MNSLACGYCSCCSSWWIYLKANKPACKQGSMYSFYGIYCFLPFDELYLLIKWSNIITSWCVSYATKSRRLADRYAWCMDRVCKSLWVFFSSLLMNIEQPKHLWSSVRNVICVMENSVMLKTSSLGSIPVMILALNDMKRCTIGSIQYSVLIWCHNVYEVRSIDLFVECQRFTVILGCLCCCSNSFTVGNILSWPQCNDSVATTIFR